MKFHLNDLKDLPACDPARARMYQDSRQYTLNEAMNNGLVRDDVMWFVRHMSDKNPKVNQRFRQWMAVCGADIQKDSTIDECILAFNSERRRKFAEYLDSGMSKEAVREKIRTEEYAQLLQIFQPD